jgi:hypothetical protein
MRSTWPTRSSWRRARRPCTDSRTPIDLAAFAIDHGDGTGQPGLVQQILRGQLPGDLTRDDILDNITLYWLTNTGVSAARLYWENKAGFFEAKPISIPYAISVFPDELYQAPRSWAERAYPHNLIHYSELDRGGHFAAWETAATLLRRDSRRLQTTAHVANRGASHTQSPAPKELRQSGRTVSLEQWNDVFTNGFLPDEQVRATYERYHIPAPGGLVWDTVLANIKPGHQDTWVDYHNDDRAPLLFVSGSEDHLMPPSVQRSNASRR